MDNRDQIDARVTDLVIRLILLGLFIVLALTLVRPFLPILVWAMVLAVALAPIHTWLSNCLRGRRKLAAFILTLAMLAVVIGPVAALAASLVESTHRLISHINGGNLKLPTPPESLSALPLIGEKIVALWSLATTNLEGLVLRFREVLAPLGKHLLYLFSSIGFDLVKFMVAIIVSGILVLNGPELAIWGRRIAARIVAPRGEKFVDLATVTIRNVSRGVVGVALLQSILISIVLQFAGVSSAGLLGFIILILCILQIGPGLVVLPVLVWCWLTMPTAHALLLTSVLVPLTFMDNVLKPLLMARGLSTPTIVIFIGVIGGTLSFGLIGLFLGPVVLAVFYDLLLTWVMHPVEPPPHITPGTSDKAPPQE
ncbi:AI-2E family transporter [Paracoccus aestuariivivens]|uniref:AI-2E family transporter n=1 Tax=Paracoccus aestuariivivens TaxID=1820333 RepID=UPI001B8C9345|nr:AI-2E family transporter [Paracoccus aestuariivivens]